MHGGEGLHVLEPQLVESQGPSAFEDGMNVQRRF